MIAEYLSDTVGCRGRNVWQRAEKDIGVSASRVSARGYSKLDVVNAYLKDRA